MRQISAVALHQVHELRQRTPQDDKEWARQRIDWVCGMTGM